MTDPETPEGRFFQEAMLSDRPRRRRWIQPPPPPVEARGPCDCGCHTPDGIWLAGQWMFGSRAELERCIMLLRSAADQLWGEKPCP